MEFKVEDKEKFKLIYLSGRCDLTDFEKFNSVLQESISGDYKEVLIDCTDFEYINSSGLKAIIMNAKEFKQKGGNFSFVNLGTNVEKVFSITGYTDLFKIFKTTEEALKYHEK